MSDQPDQVRQIAWSQAFPVVRLFSTVRLALDFKRMVLALAAVLIVYVAGAALDGMWGTSGGVLQQSDSTSASGLAGLPPERLARRLRAMQTGPAGGQPGGALRSEIEAFATSSPEAYHAWRRQASEGRRQLGAVALLEAGRVTSIEEGRQQLADDHFESLLVDADYRSELEAVRELVEDHVAKGHDALDDNKAFGASLKAERRTELRHAADALRRILSDDLGYHGDIASDYGKLVETVMPSERGAATASQIAERQRVMKVVNWQVLRRQHAQLKPTGPFRTLMIYESRCFAAAVQGVATGRWGFGDGAFGAEPALASSIGSAFQGIIWLIVYRPFYAILLTTVLLLVFAYFGGAICRSAAVQSAREESIPTGESLRFAGEKFGGLIVAPLMPVIVFVIIVILLFFGGLIGALPGIGEIITSVLYPLGLLGGFALAMVFLALLLGFHLMWPTIAAEGSDGFDALSRACSYVGSRAWHVAFYTLVLLVYGGLAFVMMRLITALTLKMAHSSTKLGMDLVSSGVLEANGKLSAIWTMPAWGELPLLPAIGGPAFWGTFHNAPLTGSEMLALFFFRLWIYIIVAALGAFVVSFFYCGSTQMYFLLRRDVDATDYDEVYYEEEPEEELLTAPAPDAENKPAEEGENA